MCRYYKINLTIFKAGSVEEFNQKYICRSCREKAKGPPYYIRTTSEYKEFYKLIQEQVDIAIERNINDPTVQKNLIQTMKNILDKYKITEYTYDVVNGELKGIILSIPFLKNIYINLKVKEKRRIV